MSSEQVEPQEVANDTDVPANINQTRDGTHSGDGTDGAQAPTWQYAEGVSGEGEVPEWFIANKYRTVEEQAKAANELRKKLGSKAEDAPEAYEIDYDSFGIKKDDPVLAEFNTFFKDMNVAQADYEKIIKKFVDIQTSHGESLEKQKTEAFNAFGPDTKETVGRLNTWIDNSFTAEEQDIVKSFMTSAEEVRVLEKMRQGLPKSAPPTVHQTATASSYETYASVNADIRKNWTKMQSDPDYRDGMERRRKEAYTRENQR